MVKKAGFLRERVWSQKARRDYNSLSEQAAALLQSLVSNHSFVDGNKRIAVMTALVFFDPNEAETFIIERVIKKKAEVAEIRSWLERNFK